jgi:hypothetical protein
MPILSKPSSAARTALIYITVGALMIVWSGIWFVYLGNNGPVRPVTWYFCAGFMLTGLTLLGIGFGLGRIGRAARHAELPPPEVTAAEIQVGQNAAAQAPMAVPVNPALGAAAINNQPVLAGAPAEPAPVPGTPPPVNANQSKSPPAQV